MKKFFCIPLMLCVALTLHAQLAEQRPITLIDSVHEYDLNPHTASYTYDAQVLNGLYEGLFICDPATLAPKSALCISYKVSRDKKRWTFTLREDAFFSDGTPITAQDVRESWLGLLETPYAPYASLLDCIAGAREFREGTGKEENVKIDARSKTTLVVRLTQPTPHLPNILCHHAFSVLGPEAGVYSGPYCLEDYEDGVLVLEKNNFYYDADSVQVPQIVIMQSDDVEQNTYLFNTGKADWLLGDSQFDSYSVLNLDSLHLGSSFATQFLFFKTNNEPWNEVDVRNALLEAIPYDELRKDNYIKATTLVYPLSGYPTVTGLDDYDLEDAKALMTEARERLGIAPDEILPLVFAINDSDYMKSLAEILHDAWEPLGVELSVQVTPIERYYSSIDGWNADLFSYSWVGDFGDPLAFLELFRGASSLNVGHYENKEYDLLLEQASLADTAEERYKLLSKAEQLLLDEGMVIPISHPVTLHAIDCDEIGGWALNPFDVHPLKYLFIKKKQLKIPNVV